MARRGENIYKRKDGRYEGRYIKYYDLSGKAVYGYIYSRSYEEVRGQLARCKAQKHCATTALSLSSWLDIWYSSLKNSKPTTRSIYKSHIQNHIKPAIGSIQLRKINSYVLQNFINNLKCSPSTSKTVFSTLKTALKAAEMNNYIVNTWSNVRLPKSGKSFVRILTQSEQQQLENILDNENDIGIWLALYTGLRIGELCALKWSDIDFQKGILTVNGTQARTEKGIEIISPKSQSSKRKIPIPQFIICKLKNIEQKYEFVISRKAKETDVRTYRRYFKALLAKAHLPEIKFHAIRHTFATRALEVGMDYKTLSEILGHSTVSITLDLYAHSLDEHKKREMDKLGSIWA